MVTGKRKIKAKTLKIFICLSLSVFLIIFIIAFYKVIKPVSYIPSLNQASVQSLPVEKAKINLPWGTLIIDGNGGIKVINRKGQILLSGIKYFADYENFSPKYGIDDLTINSINDSLVLISGTGCNNTEVFVFIGLPKNTNRLDFSVKTKYNRPSDVKRESFLAEFDMPVKCIYKNNGQVDSANQIKSEYWLERNGVHLGDSSRSAFIFHNPSITSLQIDTRRKFICFNLDYYLDHPYVNIPFQENGQGRFNDFSTSRYNEGNTKFSSFSICFNDQHFIAPRFMYQPYGYLSSYIFTEHADLANIKTHRALYFGSEEITEIDNAIGGFAKHNIAVTKSVFYTDPGRPEDIAITNSLNCDLFLNFLDQLNSKGIYDICLHTPENVNSSREKLEESIKFMKQRFNTISWIDHGIFSGAINREAFAGDGLDSASKYFCADLWEKFETKYFWSPHFEMLPSFKKRVITSAKKLDFVNVASELWKLVFSPSELENLGLFKAFLKLPYRLITHSERKCIMNYYGEQYPYPLFWQHPTRTKNFYSWRTDYVTRFGTNSNENYYDQDKLNHFVSNWDVFINHSYPPRFEEKVNDGYWIRKSNKILINPDFDHMLSLISDLQKKGYVLSTTVRDIMNYWIQLKQIKYFVDKNGKICITNDSKSAIHGLSMTANARAVRVDGQIPHNKKIGHEIVFWFDIGSHETINLDFQK